MVGIFRLNAAKDVAYWQGRLAFWQEQRAYDRDQQLTDASVKEGIETCSRALAEAIAERKGNLRAARHRLGLKVKATW